MLFTAERMHAALCRALWHEWQTTSCIMFVLLSLCCDCVMLSQCGMQGTAS